MKKNRLFPLAYIRMFLILALLILSCAPVQRYPVGLDIADQSSGKGLELGRQWKLEEAKEQFEKASKADPSSADYVVAIISLGVIEDFNTNNIEKEAVDHIMRGRWSEAIAEYDKAIEINPRRADAYKNRGLIWFFSGDHRRAIADFDKALELNPGYDLIYALRGDAIFYTGSDFGKAIADYNKALELNPQNLRALNGIAWLLATCSDTRYRDGVKAIELAQKAVELCPIASYYDTLAAAYAEAGKFEDAITTQEKAIALAKGEGYSKYRIDKWMERLTAYSSHKKKDEAERLEDRDVDTAEQFLIKGIEYGAQGKFREAKEEFEKSLEVDPFHHFLKEALQVIEDVRRQKIKSKAAIHLFKGIAHNSKRQWNDAIAEFDKAIEINPTYAVAYRVRGIAYRFKGQHDQAISDFNKAIEINPRYENAYVGRGITYGIKDQYDQAISDFNKAIELNPKVADAYYYRGIGYGDKGQYDQAISDYTKAIELDPRHADAYNNRGIIYDNVNRQHDRAIFDYTKAIEISPKFAWAYNNRALAYFIKREYEKSWDDAQKAQNLGYQVQPGFLKELREASSKAYVDRGGGHFFSGQYDKAISYYNKAIELNPENVFAYFNRGVAYEYKGQYDKAISDYTKAIELNPRDSGYYNNRGMLYMMKLGIKEKACSDWKRACELGDCYNYSNAKRNGLCE